MQAIVLAGGKGTRLRPYTTVFPKPLVPVGERPILEIIVNQLRAHGYTKITFAVNHLAELIEAYFSNGEKLEVEISYSHEGEALGTAGPIGILENLDEDFLVMNGDILTDIDYRNLMRSHSKGDQIATIATFKKQVPISLGVLEVSPNQRLIGYREKPTLNYQVSMGIYIFNRRILKYIPRGQYLDLPDLMCTLINEGEDVYCYEFQGEWLDIGRPEDYEEALKKYTEKASSFVPEGI